MYHWHPEIFAAFVAGLVVGAMAMFFAGMLDDADDEGEENANK